MQTLVDCTGLLYRAGSPELGGSGGAGLIPKDVVNRLLVAAPLDQIVASAEWPPGQIAACTDLPEVRQELLG